MRVRSEFERNFAGRAERGGAVSIWHKGQKVVDLWGGWREAEVPSTNGHGNARSTAGSYVALAANSEIGGVRFLGRSAIAAGTIGQVIRPGWRLPPQPVVAAG